jgi:GT2 family glycosyltransferase
VHIPVIIPYLAGGNIGAAYNREVERLAPGQWFIFLDYDAMIMNPHWHWLCERTIARVGTKAGLVSCLTNRIGCTQQRYAGGVDENNHDNLVHRKVAQSLWVTNGDRLLDCTEMGNGVRFSGFFLMSNRDVWEKVGGFKPEGFFHVDVDYHERVKAAGLRTYLMLGLYCYHRYLRETSKAPYFSEPVA